VRNITLSADERLLDRAREKARLEHRSLNEAFRAWLAEWTQTADPGPRYDELMERLETSCEARGPYSRDERNER
jgi:hypothetical protein